MERDSYNENFERFLRTNADNLRLPASERVWKNISKKMDRRRRWIGFTLSAILLMTAVGGYFLVHNSVKPLPHPVATTENQKQNSDGAEREVSTLRTVAPTQQEDLKTPLAVVNHSTTSPLLTNNVKNIHRENTTAINIPETNTDNKSTVVNENNFKSQIVDTYNDTPEQKDPIQLSSTKNSTPEELPLDIESVVSSYKAKVKKFSLQVSFSPMVSYRKLSENKSYMPTTLPSYSVNDAVTQKPDMGLELGVSGKYTVSKNVKLIGGLQFNVSRYDIKAFTAAAPTVAIFRLNTSTGVDYVNASTPFSNTGGSQSDWLQNLYLQLSVPMGVELKLAGDNHTQFGIATTIQPTYVFGDKAYLIASDYQSYAQVPGLTRHWNVNTNFQTFVSYSTGNMRWQVGPQVRYQVLSSFVSKYPVKENLFDFGLRVGISLNK